MQNRTKPMGEAAQAVTNAITHLQDRDNGLAGGIPSAEAVRSGRRAMVEIDQAIRCLNLARETLGSELRREAAATAARVDQLLAHHRGAAS